MRRLPDWPSRLDGFIRERRSHPFVWGVNDCCTFAEGAVRAQTGVALLAGTARPATRFGAARFLLGRGHRDVAGLATELLGPSLRTPRLAQRGDVVCFFGGVADTLGVCLGAHVCAPGASRLEFLPRSAIRIAWRV